MDYTSLFVLVTDVRPSLRGRALFTQSTILCVMPFLSYARLHLVFPCGSSGCSNVGGAANTLQSLAEIHGEGSGGDQSSIGRECFTNTTDGLRRQDNNLNERRDPKVTSNGHDGKHGRGSRRSADASLPVRHPLVGDPVSAAVVGTGEVAAIPQQPEKRGRAQKKRARKIKEKMRQLCIDANAAANGTAEGAGVIVEGARAASPNDGRSRKAGATYEELCAASIELGAACCFRVVVSVFMFMAPILFNVQYGN